MKLTFKCEHNDREGQVISEINFVTHNVGLPEILEDFQCFLKAAGFSFDGNLDIIDDDLDRIEDEV